MKIRNKVLELIETDDSYDLIDEKNIKKYYANSNDKDSIDNVFISLTGFSLETILKESYNENDSVTSDD